MTGPAQFAIYLFAMVCPAQADGRPVLVPASACTYRFSNHEFADRKSCVRAGLVFHKIIERNAARSAVTFTSCYRVRLRGRAN